jgi:hypothetical protein
MSTPAVTARLAQNRELVSLVLAAERAALADVAQFRRRTGQFLVASCLRALLVQKRTEVRIRRLRERIAAATQVRQLRIGREVAALEADLAQDESMLTPLEAAIVKVTAELAGVTAPD